MEEKKSYTVFYNCPYCKKETSGEILEGSRLIKCANIYCGKLSDISLVDGFDDHKNQFEKPAKKYIPRKSIVVAVGVLLILLIPLVTLSIFN